MKLSPNFARIEFERNSRQISNQIPPEAVPSYISLCQSLLEPIRAEFCKPIIITSGYRCSELNQMVGGSRKSHHKATEKYAAADFQIPGIPLRTVFNWIRLESGLWFDQVILERGREERHEWDDTVHLGWRASKPRRQALEGFTRNAGRYTGRYVGPPLPRLRELVIET